MERRVRKILTGLEVEQAGGMPAVLDAFALESGTAHVTSGYVHSRFNSINDTVEVKAVFYSVVWTGKR
jgi:hypothetical protein